jgi:hypothetical protein
VKSSLYIMSSYKFSYVDYVVNKLIRKNASFVDDG